MPVAAAGMLPPDEMIAVAPAPIVGMDLDAHPRRERVILMDVPAGVLVAHNAGGGVGGVHGGQGEQGATGQRCCDDLAAIVHGTPSGFDCRPNARAFRMVPAAGRKGGCRGEEKHDEVQQSLAKGAAL